MALRDLTDGNHSYAHDPRVISTTRGASFTDDKGEVWYVRMDLATTWQLVNADRTTRLVNYASIDDALAVLLGPPQPMAAVS